MIFCTFGLFFLNLLKKESVKLKKISSKNMENRIQELTDKIYREGVEKEMKKHSDLSVVLAMKQQRL